MIVKTKVLDRAAYYCLSGGTIVKIEGTLPDNIFTIECDEWVKDSEKVGMVNWRKFANMRRTIKRKTRRLAGLPERYHSPKKLQLKDVATFKKWDR